MHVRPIERVGDHFSPVVNMVYPKSLNFNVGNWTKKASPIHGPHTQTHG